MPPTTPPPIQSTVVPRAGTAVASLVLGILSLTCFSVLAGIPALILGIMGISKIGNSKGALRGKGQAIAGVVCGGLSLLLFPVSAALILPAVASGRAKAQEAVCMNNVKQCVNLCLMYATEHNDQLPQKWEDLGDDVIGGDARSHLLKCPLHRNEGAAPSYELPAAGQKLSDLPDQSKAVIVRETEASHRNRRIVGYADGHVEAVAN
jgi:prepilin-type processing-associated H-X9-DG protein